MESNPRSISAARPSSGAASNLPSRPPDATHPYGHGKAEPLAAGIVAVGVLLAAVGLAIQSVREILLPHHAPAPFTLIVLIVVIVVKEFLYRVGDPARERTWRAPRCKPTPGIIGRTR